MLVPQSSGYVAMFRSDWLLAHESLDGSRWDELDQEAEIYLGDQLFLVEDMYKFQALEPENPRGSLLYLETGEVMSVPQALQTIRSNCDECLILQTCIYQRGNPAWGRLFVVAEKQDATNVQAEQVQDEGGAGWGLDFGKAIRYLRSNFQ